jgi:hypothetical protein
MAMPRAVMTRSTPSRRPDLALIEAAPKVRLAGHPQ